MGISIPSFSFNSLNTSRQLILDSVFTVEKNKIGGRGMAVNPKSVMIEVNVCKDSVRLFRLTVSDSKHSMSK